MPARAKETAFARSERLQQESLRLRRKAQFNAIIAGLRAHPEFITKVFDQVDNLYQSIGKTLLFSEGDVIEVDDNKELGGSTWGIERRSKYVKAEDASGGASDAGAGSVDQSVVATDNGDKRRLDSFSVDQIADLLSKVEKVVFARAALKGLRARGARKESKSSLLEV